MLTRWQEENLIARIRETKTRLASARATIDPRTGGAVQPWALDAGWSPERDYFDPFLGRFTESYPARKGGA